MPTLAGLPTPLTAIQLLWLNLMTDGLLGLAMGTEQAEPDVMRRPPIDPRSSIWSDGWGTRTVWVGLVIGVVALGLGAFTLTPALVAPASAAEVNFGHCISSIDPSLKPYQAPGQNGTGPLTIVNGKVHIPGGFNGAQGCAKS